MNMRPRWMKLIWIPPLAILGILLFIAIGGEIVMLLWNWLVPTLFGWRQITFWQAVGLLALCRILFGGHGVLRTARSNMRHRMQERWAHMTPEEREKMRERFRGRCGPFEPPKAEPTA